MYIFCAPDINANNLLPEEESAHCIRVLRKKAGDEIRITDGQGFFYDAHITVAHPKHCEIAIDRQEGWVKPWGGDLHLAIAPTKNMERMEWLFEKITELGIDTITPLLCRYSERKELKTARLEKIMVSAMKQSQKALLPRLNLPTLFSIFIEQPFDGEKLIAHCYEGRKKTLKQAYTPKQDAVILIGPEGDFSEEEIALAVNKGFTSVTLGDSCLRTETAALFACSAFHLVNSSGGFQ